MTGLTTIQSRQNAALRHLSRLGRDKKYRRATGEMLCEGSKMLEEALSAHARIKTVLLQEGWQDSPLSALVEQLQSDRTVPACYEAPPALFALASDLETPQPVVFSCGQPHWDSGMLRHVRQALLLDGIQDPGNLGTILRTAEAFAIHAVVLCEGCTDLFSPKVIRATMGAVFHLPCLSLPLTEAVSCLRQNGLTVYASSLQGSSVPLSSVPLHSAAVIIGNEGRGVSAEALALSDQCIRIPMQGKAESLNAGIAASIILYEMRNGGER